MADLNGAAGAAGAAGEGGLGEDLEAAQPPGGGGPRPAGGRMRSTVAGNAAFFLGPILALLAVQEVELRRHARKLAEERRTRGRR